MEQRMQMQKGRIRKNEPLGHEWFWLSVMENALTEIAVGHGQS